MTGEQLDPPDPEVCPGCGCYLDELDDADAKIHLWDCMVADLAGEREFDELHDEGRLGYQKEPA